MTRARLGLLAVAGAAGTALAGFLFAAGGPWAGPAPRSWAAADAWYEHAGPASVALMLARVVGSLGALRLLVGALLHLTADLAASPSLRRAADAVGPRALRHLAARGLAGASVAVVVATGPVAASPSGEGPGVAVMEVLDAPPPSTTTPTTTSTPTTSTTTTAPITTAPSPPPASLPPAVAAAAPATVVVGPGDSFWSLAVEAVGAPPGPAGERAVDRYWRRLVALNRAQLVDPANPDLLYPGQVLHLAPLERAAP